MLTEPKCMNGLVQDLSVTLEAFKKKQDLVKNKKKKSKISSYFFSAYILLAQLWHQV